MQTFHGEGDLEKAVTIMQSAFTLHLKHITAEDVNLLLDLYMPQGLYDQSIAVSIEYVTNCNTSSCKL